MSERAHHPVSQLGSDHLQLELHVLPRVLEGYPVILRLQPEGQGEAQSVSPFDPADPALQADLEVFQAHGLTSDQELKTLGARLWPGGSLEPGAPPGLLTGPVLQLFLGKLNWLGEESTRSLHLRLRLEPPELAALPWELAFDPGRQQFLGADRQLWLSRVHSTSAQVGAEQRLERLPSSRAVPAPGALRGLFLLSEAANLNLEAELSQVMSLPPPASSRLVWDAVRSETALRSRLQGAPLQVLHVSGHGFFQGEGRLELGEGRILDAETFVDWVRDQPALQLVTLNACETASLDGSASVQGLARRLQHAGVPAVVAMQGRMPDEDARVFARGFYQALLLGPHAGEVACAVTQGRRAILEAARRAEAAGEQEGLHPLWAFALPVAYLRSAEAGRLTLPSGQGLGLRLRAGGLRLGTAMGLSLLLLLVLQLVGLHSPLHDRQMHLSARFLTEPVRYEGLLLVDLGGALEAHHLCPDLLPVGWPWHRATLASVLEALVREGASAIALDVVLSTDPHDGESASEFLEGNQRISALHTDLEARGGAGILGSTGTVTQDDAGRRCLLEDFDPVAWTRAGLSPALPRGHTLFPTEKHASKRIWSVYALPLPRCGDPSGTRVASLAMALASRGAGGKALLVGSALSPLPRLPIRPPPRVSACSVMRGDEEVRDQVKGKRVLVGLFSGVYAEDDSVWTPWQASGTGEQEDTERAEGKRPGLEVHAAVTSSLLEGNGIEALGGGLGFVLELFLLVPGWLLVGSGAVIRRLKGLLWVWLLEVGLAGFMLAAWVTRLHLPVPLLELPLLWGVGMLWRRRGEGVSPLRGRLPGVGWARMLQGRLPGVGWARRLQGRLPGVGWVRWARKS